jgi:hypothetical protein
MTKLEQIAETLKQKVLARHQILLDDVAMTMVRAVVEELREPSSHQYAALAGTDKLWRDLNSDFVWKTYVDAILNEQA